MRRIHLTISFLTLSLLAVAVPLTAHASSELLTITGNSETFTFLLPSDPVSAGDITSSTDYFTLTGIPATGPGVPSSDTLDFYDATDGGGIDDTSLAISFSGPVLFGGTPAAPTFGPESGSGLLDINNVSYSYTIADASSTPEPSSLVLLGTGALGLAGAFRRRLLA